VKFSLPVYLERNFLMAQPSTIVGVFDDYSTAEQVSRELNNIGIPRESVEIQSNFRTGAAGRSDYGEDRPDHEGGISGFFRRLFGTEDKDEYAGHYAEAVRRGSTVLCVTAPQDKVEQAIAVMNQHGAVDIDRHVENYRGAGYQTHDPERPAYDHDEAVRERQQFHENSGDTVIPVAEEELQVGKRVVRRGGVRVYSRTIEQPVEQDVTLREEHVKVERRPANRPVAPGEASRLRDRSIEVTEMAEEAVIQKRARVREEVIVGKETSERTEHISDTVRRTEVKVDRIGAERQGADYDDDFRRDFEDRYARSGESYETYHPAYEYGYRMASDPRYRGKDWSDVEQTLKTDYMRNQPNSSWEKAKGAVRYGWEKVTGKRS